MVIPIELAINRIKSHLVTVGFNNKVRFARVAWKAFTLSLIGYTSTCERALRHSDWLCTAFFTCENKAYRFLQMSFME